MVWFAASTSAARPLKSGSSDKRQQSADTRGAAGLALRGPPADADGGRQRREGGGERRYRERLKAQEEGCAVRGDRREAARALGLEGEVDDQDRVLLGDADREEHAD